MIAGIMAVMIMAPTGAAMTMITIMITGGLGHVRAPSSFGRAFAIGIALNTALVVAAGCAKTRAAVWAPKAKGGFARRTSSSVSS